MFSDDPAPSLSHSLQLHLPYQKNRYKMRKADSSILCHSFPINLLSYRIVSRNHCTYLYSCSDVIYIDYYQNTLPDLNTTMEVM